MIAVWAILGVVLFSAGDLVAYHLKMMEMFHVTLVLAVVAVIIWRSNRGDSS
jgi:hypothetical protein